MGSKKKRDQSDDSDSSSESGSDSSDSSETSKSKQKKKHQKSKKHSSSSESEGESKKKSTQKSKTKRRENSPHDSENNRRGPKKSNVKPSVKPAVDDPDKERDEKYGKRKRSPSPENRDRRNRDHKRDRYETGRFENHRGRDREYNNRHHDDRYKDRRDDYRNEKDRRDRNDRRDDREHRDRREDNRNYSDRNRDRNNRDNYRKRRSSSVDHANPTWGKATDENKSDKPGGKQKPNFGLSGKLTEETNTYRGVVIKYSEPPEARKPKRRWRLYPFKGEKSLQTLYIHRESAYLIGRERKIVDLPVDHPSCSKQHAALQYRLVPFTREDGSSGKRIRPYLIDLDSANGTFINNNRIETRKYVELLEKDVIKFGYSSREYVLLHENSKDEAQDDDVKQEEVDVKEENTEAVVKQEAE